MQPVGSAEERRPAVRAVAHGADYRLESGIWRETGIVLVGSLPEPERARHEHVIVASFASAVVADVVLISWRETGQTLRARCRLFAATTRRPRTHEPTARRRENCARIVRPQPTNSLWRRVA
jgi:hypothetical protein